MAEPLHDPRNGNSPTYSMRAVGMIHGAASCREFRQAVGRSLPADRSPRIKMHPFLESTPRGTHSHDPLY